VVRNGYHQSREVLTSAGAVEVTAPRVNDKRTDPATGEGPGSRAAGLAMAFKLMEAAQDRWRAVNAPHLVALVRAGAVFRDDALIERPEPAAA
jgi:hypothetical protein